MSSRRKIGRNDLCPCGSAVKYKTCCEGRVDWNRLLQAGESPVPYLSVRGRNYLFLNRLAEVLQLDKLPDGGSLAEYKKAFTAENVRRIHESILEIWPPDLDIARALARPADRVSGLYIGDYEGDYIQRGILRHSIYADKILIIDPFLYPLRVRAEYNPLVKPEEHRAQTLKSANFWFSLIPWMEAGIVEIIRAPGDFDGELNWTTLMRQKKKYDENPNLRAAAERSASTLSKRHAEQFQQLLLYSPDDYIRRTYEESGAGADFSPDDFLAYIRHRRETDPNFLEPFSGESAQAQVHMVSSGAGYEMAKLTANLTGSYLVTDIDAKWIEIEHDCASQEAIQRSWNPFAKALQNAPLRFLNAVTLPDALALRAEGRLESFRAFLRKVWRRAASTDAFAPEIAHALAEELRDETERAKIEWEEIDRQLLKRFEKLSFAFAAPLIATGHADFLAAAGVAAGAIGLVESTSRRVSFPERYPAAFFMNLDADAADDR